MRGRFNIFQCAMLRWREFEPYNAVHAITLPGALDHDRLSRAIEGQLTDWGLAEVTLDHERRRYEYRAATRAVVELPVLPGGTDPDAVLAAEMQRHLNLGFPREGGFAPFRFFAVQVPDSFRLGVAYDHVFAGGDSIVALLKGIASRYTGTVATAPPPELYPPTYRRLFGTQFGAYLRGLFSLPAIIARVRRCVRPRYVHGDARGSAFVQMRLTEAETAGVLRTAAAWSVTVNDLLLAMLLKLLDEHVTGREFARRRNEIAIASVINIRAAMASGPAAVFGQFLSSFMVSHRVPPGVELAELARDIHAQVDRMKRRKLYLQTLWAIAVGALTWRSMTPERRNRMYARNYPVWAGMTTVYVDPIWRTAPGDAPIPEYVRGVSTGPFTPLLMAPTTANGRMSIGLTIRMSAFHPAEIARLQVSLLETVRGLG